jgi:tRNA(Ser,Leu) C12 N-acetylase TAN1
MMTAWNVLATAQPHQLQRLFDILRPHGEFQHAPFRGVIVGMVLDRTELFEALLAREARKGGTLAAIGHIVPIDRTFGFEPEHLEALLREAVTPYAASIGPGSFHVRMERRGLKGELHSQPIELALAGHLSALLEAAGHPARIDFADPDAVVVVETLGNLCGVGLVTRALTARYPFVHVR